MTTINNPATDNKANALLFITNVYGQYDNHVSGVWYSGGKWIIYHENMKSMPTNAKYNVLVMKPSDKAFMHRAAAGNTSSHITTINHPSCNGNPNAVLLVTQNYKRAYNAKAVGVWYNGSKWTIYNQDKTKMPSGANFNVLVLKKGSMNLNGRAKGRISVFKASSSTVNKSYDHLRDLPVKGKQAKIFVTQNYGKNGPYNAKTPAVWNYGPNWTVYNKDKSNMPKNAQYNVLMVSGQEILRPDEPVDNIKKEIGTTKASYIRIFNMSGYVAKVDATYNINGKSQSASTGSLTINGAYTFNFPKGVSNIKLKLYKHGLTGWEKVNTLGQPAKYFNNCLKLYGSYFNPKYTEDCEKQPTYDYIKFFNESGYVARFKVTYDFKGAKIETETGSIALGTRKTVKIPDNATNVRILAEGNTVFSWKTIFDKTYEKSPNRCFKVYATIFDPKWNNNCD